MTSPSRTTGLQPRPSSSLDVAALGAGKSVQPLSYQTHWPSLALQQPPLATSTADALMLLLCGDILRWVGVSARHAPGCVAVVTTRVSKALAVFALESPFCNSAPSLADRRTRYARTRLQHQGAAPILRTAMSRHKAAERRDLDAAAAAA